MTELERSYLEMFGPNTYGLEIPYEVATNLEFKGLVEWVPPKFGSVLYAITDAGREALIGCAPGG